MTTLTFYISPDGNDAWSGARPDPDAASADGPFATFARARQAVRQARGERGPSGPITVYARGGVYRLPEPLTLGPRDSGEPGCPVAYAAFPGERAVISGGRPLRDWRPFRGPIVQCDIPRGSRPIRQLFCRGRRMPRAGWPKPDPADPLYTGWAFVEASDDQQPHAAFLAPPAMRERGWARPELAEVNIFTGYGWLNEIIGIRSFDADGRVVLRRPVKDFNRLPWFLPVPLLPTSRFRVENVLEELTQPGEWCADPEAGRLCFWPPDPGALDEVELPALGCLVDLDGAQWVNLEGFTFACTLDGDNTHREGVDGIGAMFNIGGLAYGGEAVRLRNCRRCRIAGNRFDAVGCNAVYLEQDCARNVVAGNEIGHAGANGIVLAGDALKHPFANRIEDNDIHHGGVFCKYTAGVFAGVSDGNFIRHNRIAHMPHHAINLSDNPAGRNVVEYNEIRFADEEIADSAAINLWMERPLAVDAQRCGHVIRFNLIADTYGCEVAEHGGVKTVGRTQGPPATGIYLDNVSSHCLIYGNLIARAGNCGIVVHMGKNNWIENNLIVDCPVGIRFQDVVSRSLEYWKPLNGFMTGHVVRRNVVASRCRPAFGLSLDGWSERVLAMSDENLFAAAGDDPAPLKVEIEPFRERRVLPLADWQAMGYDEGSLAADPLLVAAPDDRYRLAADSPAWALGFAPIAVERIGLRNRQC
jgi:parallel beta-helix repeat protein